MIDAMEFVNRHFHDGLGWDDEAIDEQGFKGKPEREPDFEAAAEEILALPPTQQAAFVCRVFRAHYELGGGSIDDEALAGLTTALEARALSEAETVETEALAR